MQMKAFKKELQATIDAKQFLANQAVSNLQIQIPQDDSDKENFFEDGNSLSFQNGEENLAPSSEKKRDKVLNDVPKTGGIQPGTHFGSSQSRQTIFFSKFQSKSTRNYENIKKTQEMLDFQKMKRFSFHQEAEGTVA